MDFNSPVNGQGGWTAARRHPFRRTNSVIGKERWWLQAKRMTID